MSATSSEIVALDRISSLSDQKSLRSDDVYAEEHRALYLDFR